MGDTIEELTQKIRADLQSRQQQVAELEARAQVLQAQHAQSERAHNERLNALTEEHTRKLADMKAAVEQERASLDGVAEQQRTLLARERALMPLIAAAVPDQIWLNVGGTNIYTTKTTLSAAGPDSMLTALVSGRWELPVTNEGSLFLDRDGEVFSVLVGWLRSRCLPVTYEMCDRLRGEAEYFCLGELCAILDERKATRFLSFQWVPTVRPGERHCRDVVGGTLAEREWLNTSYPPPFTSPTRPAGAAAAAFAEHAPFGKPAPAAPPQQLGRGFGRVNGAQAGFAAAKHFPAQQPTDTCCSNALRAREYLCKWHVAVHELMMRGWVLVHDEVIDNVDNPTQRTHEVTFERQLEAHKP